MSDNGADWAKPSRSDADWAKLSRLDSRHVWHPYAPLPASTPSLPVVSAQGVRLRLADGRELIDGMASWWCAIHGYRHPRLDEAVREQLDAMAHVMFGGLTHEPAVRLAERLVEITPAGLEHVFFADSGSVAVEVAIKMALQSQRAAGRGGRTRLLTVRGGYHGDTFGAMGVCDPIGGMHSLFTGALAEHVFADRPPDGFDRPLDAEWEAWAARVRALAADHSDELAGVIVEPVVQGAGGMRFHSPACVRLLREVCDEHGVPLILDEIATGLGRTGALFACEHADVAPDIMCVGKALTGGYMTLAATLCTSDIARAISDGEGGALMHGPTYMANPLACAVALASLDELLAGDDGVDGGAVAHGGKEETPAAADVRGWREQVARIERGLREGLAQARELPGVADVRVLGAIGVVQLDHDVDVAAATSVAVEHGVWLRPFRDLIYTMPAYAIDDDDLARVAEAMLTAVV